MIKKVHKVQKKQAISCSEIPTYLIPSQIEYVLGDCGQMDSSL